MNTRLAPNQIARRQHALVTFDQALAAGLSPCQVRHRVRSGEWSPIRPGVYAIGGAPPTWLQAVAAVALSSGPNAWISHQTAGALWSLPGVTDDAIHVVTSLDRRIRLAGAVGHRSGALFSADLTTRAGIPVTTPARTLVDVSACLTSRQLGMAVDDALRRRVMTLVSLQRCVARLAGAPGRRPAAVEELLLQRLPGCGPGDSDLETRVLRLLVAAGFPPPVQQHRVRLGGRTFRIDLAYPELCLAIELDGWEFHRARTAFDDDRSRANLLVVQGWAVVRFTSRSTDEEIVACIGRFGHLGAA
ncbi:MAG: type IV toxin-antitoxin system AbiEi family antitoxin domain-containing protein [Actinomycetota bacterium]|nr:type IV toxin-antitoxin system AbiEi family antitoxin domain-containing protein [Actinomycetota bacterium]